MSGADLEYQRMLANAGMDMEDRLDAARLEQLIDINGKFNLTDVSELDATVNTGRLSPDALAWNIASTGAFVNVGLTHGFDKAAIEGAAAAAASFGGGLLFANGIFDVNSNLTIDAPCTFVSGGVIKPANGVQVILNKGIYNYSLNRIFDHSLGGWVVPKRVETYHPAWWGNIGTNDDSTTWRDMLLSADKSGERQRVAGPQGTSRFWQIDFKNVDVDARGCTFKPPVGTVPVGDPKTDYVFALKAADALNGGAHTLGGEFSTDGIAGVTAVFYSSARAWINGAYVRPLGVGSHGIYARKVTGSITPRIFNTVVYSGDGGGNGGVQQIESITQGGVGLTSYTLSHYGPNVVTGINETTVTGAIPANASSATVQAALEALTNIGVGGVAVTGAAGGPYTVIFTANGTHKPFVAVPTGGTGTVTVAITQIGVAIGGGTGTGTGIRVESPDAELVGVWVGYVDTGIITGGAGTIVDAHVWGCKNDGIVSSDGMVYDACYIESNGGWGINGMGSEENRILGGRIWRNGWNKTSGSFKGGIRWSGVPDEGGSVYCENNVIKGTVINDNFGTDIYLDNIRYVDVDAQILSNQRQSSNQMPYTTNVVEVTATCKNIDLRLRVSRKPYQNQLLVNNASEGEVNLNLGEKQFTKATPTVIGPGAPSYVALGNFVIRAKEKYKGQGWLQVEGPQAADLNLRLSAPGATGAVGFIRLGPTVATTQTNTTSAPANPVNSGGLGDNLATGLIGLGFKQAINFEFYVEAADVDGSVNISARAVNDPTPDSISVNFFTYSALQIGG